MSKETNFRVHYTVTNPETGVTDKKQVDVSAEAPGNAQQHVINTEKARSFKNVLKFRKIKVLKDV